MRGVSAADAVGLSTPTISTRRAARWASLPTGAPLPPRGAAALFLAPPLGWFLVPLIALAFDHFAGRLGDTDLAAALKHAEPDLGRLFALGVDQLQVGQVDRRFLVDNPAGLTHAGRLRVVARHGSPLNDG